MRLLEDWTLPGLFDLTQSSTNSFHFLPKTKTQIININNSILTLSLHLTNQTWLSNLKKLKIEWNQNLTSILTNLLTSLDECFLNPFTCLPISVSFTISHHHKQTWHLQFNQTLPGWRPFCFMVLNGGNGISFSYNVEEIFIVIPTI